ncbi:MAG: cupin-like domain-containing protein, partial [Novosphingobium sp.]|nr:cupin-like domain-containing protein [Novosphingobium sp.]
MNQTLPPVTELAVVDAAALDVAIASAEQPFVVRGLVADWPLV